MFSTSVDLTTRFDDHNMANSRGTLVKGVRYSTQKSLMQRVESKEKETENQITPSRSLCEGKGQELGLLWALSFEELVCVDKTKESYMLVPIETEKGNTVSKRINVPREAAHMGPRV